MKIALLEKGQGMVEYALILVLVAVVVIAAVSIMGPLVGKVFSTINKSLYFFLFIVKRNSLKPLSLGCP